MFITLPFFYLTLVLLFGLCVGSFLNVCIYRLPLAISPGKGLSFCPACKGHIAWHDNVPLFSFLWLRGRCRRCKSPIPVRYPLVESLTALLSLATFLHHPQLVPFLLYFLFFISPLIVITFIDIDTLTIPDSITLPSIPIGVLVLIVVKHKQWRDILLESSLGILIGAGILLLLAWYSLHIRKKEGMGGGDIKLAAMLGAFLGPTGILLVLVVSSLLGLVIGGTVLLVTRKGRETPIPFGPFLALAALVDFFFHPQLWAYGSRLHGQ